MVALCQPAGGPNLSLTRLSSDLSEAVGKRRVFSQRTGPWTARRDGKATIPRVTGPLRGSGRHRLLRAVLPVAAALAEAAPALSQQVPRIPSPDGGLPGREGGPRSYAGFSGVSLPRRPGGGAPFPGLWAAAFRLPPSQTGVCRRPVLAAVRRSKDADVSWRWQPEAPSLLPTLRLP